VTLRAVLFDAGDTLIRIRGASGALLLAAAERIGLALEPGPADAVWQRVLAGAGTPEELGKGRDLSPETHRTVWTELYRASGADELGVGLSDALYDLTVAPTSWEAFADTVPTLRALRRQGVPVGVVSDTGFDLRPVFDALDLSRWLDVVLLSCEHGACKPEPSVFATACAQLGVEPSETLMVGDNPLTDGGDCAAGLSVLLLPAPTPNGPRGLGHVLSLLAPAAS
jgi:HAD superfamily hydrolase (TIGR01509 family)